MKNLLLTLTVLFGLSISSYAQTWNQLYSNDQITVETLEVECNPYNKQYPFSYMLIKYTNKTSENVSFSFKFEKTYNDVLFQYTTTDVEHEKEIKTITLEGNEVREGSCSNNEEQYKMFFKNNHPKMDHKLTNIQIIEIQTK